MNKKKNEDFCCGWDGPFLAWWRARFWSAPTCNNPKIIDNFAQKNIKDGE